MNKPTAKQLWDQLVDEAGEDEIEKAASMSVEQAEKELAAAGFNVAAERAMAEAFLTQLGGRAPAKQDPLPDVLRQPPIRLDALRAQPRPRPAMRWLVAATMGGAIGGSMLYASLQTTLPVALQGAPTAPTPSSVQPTDPGPDLAAAADLRRRAFAACAAKAWDQCLARLDAAAEIDPAGDTTDEVRQARLAAHEGQQRKH